MKETIVLYPAPGIGNLVSMVELGKLILQHNPNISVIVLVASMPSDSAKYSSYISHITQNSLPISFYSLPSVSLPNLQQNSPTTQDLISLAFESIRLNIPNVKAALQTVSMTSNILAFITSSVQASYEIDIPTYYYYTSCASSLAFMLYFPTFQSQTSKSFWELKNTPLDFPGLPLFKASQAPKPILDRDHQAYRGFLNFASCLPNSNGIILNTFNSLEPRAIKAIITGACSPNSLIPSLYSIGPLITDAEDRSTMTRNNSPVDCLSWLNKQPNQTVVFLCFGSRGVFSSEQLKEIAKGLEKSNQRFLWVVKNPSATNEEPNLESLLPEGFLERTKERGLLVKSWAPQASVLGHGSVGGFVTHCGWNSVVEAVVSGVPMVAWPLYAEQHLNCVVLVEEMKVAIAINQSDHELVSADEVEKQVSEVIRSKVLREKSSEMKAMASAAWGCGGSSLDAFSKLVGSWKQDHK